MSKIINKKIKNTLKFEKDGDKIVLAFGKYPLKASEFYCLRKPDNSDLLVSGVVGVFIGLSLELISRYLSKVIDNEPFIYEKWKWYCLLILIICIIFLRIFKYYKPTKREKLIRKIDNILK